MTKRIKCAVTLFALMLGGCASKEGVDDPLEPVNREIFAFNHTLDKHAAVPAASYYKSALPDDMRDGMHNFLSNLTEPVTFANDVLQGETTRAGYSICRLGVNTTIGVIGIMDPAMAWDARTIARIWPNPGDLWGAGWTLFGTAAIGFVPRAMPPAKSSSIIFSTRWAMWPIAASSMSR